MYNRQLDIFLCVADCGSFTKAADKLCLTQPAVSNQIKAIENEFEVKIFDRKMRALTLTPEGEILYKLNRYCNKS